MSDTGIHASWQHANGVEDLRLACEVAGIETSGPKATLVKRLKAALPATGYTALTGLSRKVGEDDDGNAVLERACEAGDEVPKGVLELGGWWLYRGGRIVVTKGGE